MFKVIYLLNRPAEDVEVKIFQPVPGSKSTVREGPKARNSSGIKMWFPYILEKASLPVLE